MHTVMETPTGGWGWGVQVAPSVGFRYREAHCEDEEGGGRTAMGKNESRQNKGLLKTGNTCNKHLVY